MGNYFKDNQDLNYYIEKYIDWDALVRVTEADFLYDDGFKNVEEALQFYREILNLVGEFSAEEIAPRSKKIDQLGLKFENGEVIFPKELEEIFEKIKQLELHSMNLPRELGGMNCPILLYMICAEIIGRADVSVMAHHGFHGGIAIALLFYSIMEGTTKAKGHPLRITETRFRQAISEMSKGEAWGSMDITEPDAGSDMAKLRSRAEQDENGNWFLSGEKIFITSGHAKYHIVIARTEKSTNNDDPFSGLKGLSLFLVPTYSIDQSGQKIWYAKLNGIEKKLGHHASATVSISFEKTPAQLIGKRGDGLNLMLLLMNNARISVGFESLGLCEAAYRLAKNYAEQRPSMGKTIDKHEMIADYLDEMKTTIEGIRAISIEAGLHEELSQKMKVRLQLETLNDEKREKILKRQRYHQKKSRYYTPLVKYFSSEKAVEVSRMCIQIHGGVGYTSEYDCEKLLRDAMVFTIYEGTSQIQSLMAMKDALMGAMRSPSKFAKKAALARTTSLIALNPLKKRVAKIQSLSYSATRRLITKIAVTKFKKMQKENVKNWRHTLLKDWDPKKDFAPAMLHAERLTKMYCDKAICEILLKQTERHPERQEVLERFLDRAGPRVQYLHNVISSTGKNILKNLEENAESASNVRADL